jgi:hypothetical protein
MTPGTRRVKKHARARQRRRLITQERLERDRRQAQHAAEALQQGLDDLGLSEDLVTEIEGRLRSQQKLQGKIVGVMCPPLFGCRTNAELCRVRGWDKNLPSGLLSALPKRSRLKRLRRLGLEVLVPLWRYAASKGGAMRSRWQWTWVTDDSVFKKYGVQLGLVGKRWSGQENQVLAGIDGVLLVVVIGDGKTVATARLDRVLFSNPEALVGDGGLPGPQRGCLLRPSGVTLDGLLGIVLHLTGPLHRAANDGGDYLQSETLLALSRL